jgi:hypothetical protein
MFRHVFSLWRMKHQKSSPQSNPEPKFIDRRGLSLLWICSVQSLKRREAAGILRPYKLGRKVLYRLTDIEAVEAEAEVAR